MDISLLQPSSLHIITGGMKGKKTPHFLNVFDQLNYTDLETQIIKPACDYRSELHEEFNLPRESIVSRTGLSLPATIADDTDFDDFKAKLNPQADIYGIEEITLFQYGNELVKLIHNLREDGKTVVCSGLDKNFRGEPFEPMHTLMAYATTVEKHYGVCDLNGCNRLGEFPQRIIDGEPADYHSPIILVGASEAYEIRCLEHHEVPGKPE